MLSHKAHEDHGRVCPSIETTATKRLLRISEQILPKRSVVAHWLDASADSVGGFGSFPSESCARLPLRPCGVAGETKGRSRITETIAWLGRYKVVPILRSKDPDLSILRGMELVQLGCRCLAITLDTPEWERVVETLVKKTADLPNGCMIGVGTVEDVSGGLMAKVAALGARFALSPVNPVNFVRECKRVGVVPVPAAFSPQEVSTAMHQGAEVVQLFPAQLYTPDTLKAFKAVGSFSKVHLMPSGGVSPKNAADWIQKGAHSVGMGANLCGEDLRMIPGKTSKEAILAAAEKWRKETAPAARQLFADLSTN